MSINSNSYQMAASIIEDTIYTSENNGITWKSQDSGYGFWINIVGSNDGTKLIAASAFDYLYGSIDRGITWNRLNVPQDIWVGLASSSDASVLYAGGLIYIYKSIDGGINWFPLINSIEDRVLWTSIVCSHDGQIIAIAGEEFNGSGKSVLHISLDSGLSWIPIIVEGEPFWISLDCSSDGRHIYAVDNNLGGSIWGITITKNNDIQVTRLIDTCSNYFYSVACSGDGSTIIVTEVSTNMYVCKTEKVLESREGISAPNILNYFRFNDTKGKTFRQMADEIRSTHKARSFGMYNNNIFLSRDFGNSWELSLSVPVDEGSSWYPLAISGKGDFMAYSVINGPLYTSSDGGLNWVLQSNAGIKAWSRLFISSEPVCVIGNTRILMGDGTFKKIKYIVRGDEVVTDKEKNIVKKVANVVSSYYDGYIVKIPKGKLGNYRSIYLSACHPVWINNGQNRTYSKDIRGIENLQIHQLLYNIQFEEEGSFYVENVRLDSLSPNFYRNKMKKELYFDQSKYDETLIIKKEDDSRRGKPKMI